MRVLGFAMLALVATRGGGARRLDLGRAHSLVAGPLRRCVEPRMSAGCLCMQPPVHACACPAGLYCEFALRFRVSDRL